MDPTTTMMELLCVIPSIPGSDVFAINVREDQLVDEVKTVIKKEKPHDLAGLSVVDFALYKTHVDVSDINNVFQHNYVFNPKDELDEQAKLSSYIERGVEKVIQILVVPFRSRPIDP